MKPYRKLFLRDDLPTPNDTASVMNLDYANKAGRTGKKALCLAVLSAFLLSGCGSIWNPHIGLNKQVLPTVQASPLPDLRNVLVAWEELRVNDVESKRNSHTHIRKLLGFVTFGAAAGAGIAGLYDAHTDKILGLGLAAVTANTGGNLFVGAITTQLYNAANKTLVCIADKGLSTYSTSISIDSRFSHTQTALDDSELKVADLKNLKKLKWTTDDNKKIYSDLIAAEAAYTGAETNFKIFKGSDSAFAQQVQQAARAVITALNEEIDKNEPNLDTILNAANSIGGLAQTAFVGDQQPDAKKAEFALAQPSRAQAVAPPSLPREANEDEQKIAKSLTALMSNAADTVNQSVQTATNAVGDLSTTCAFNAPQIDTLNLVRSEVTVTKDQTVMVQVTGGKAPLNSTWDGTAPKANELSAFVLGGQVVIQGRSGLGAGASYKFVISDSRAAPERVTLTITQPAAPES